MATARRYTARLQWADEDCKSEANNAVVGNGKQHGLIAVLLHAQRPDVVHVVQIAVMLFEGLIIEREKVSSAKCRLRG